MRKRLRTRTQHRAEVFVRQADQLPARDFRGAAAKIAHGARVEGLDRPVAAIGAQILKRSGAEARQAAAVLHFHQQGNAAGDGLQRFFQRGDAAAVRQRARAQLRERQRVHALLAPAEAFERSVVKDDHFAIGAEAHVQFDAHARFAGARKGREAVFRGAVAMQPAMGIEARQHQPSPAPRGGGQEDVEKKQRQQKRWKNDPEHAAASLRVRISVGTFNIVPQDGENVKRRGRLRVKPPAQDVGKVNGWSARWERAKVKARLPRRKRKSLSVSFYRGSFGGCGLYQRSGAAPSGAARLGVMPVRPARQTVRAGAGRGASPRAGRRSVCPTTRSCAGPRASFSAIRCRSP